MKQPRRFALAASAVILAGCATTTGTVVGPLAANVSFWQHSEGTPTWTRPFAFPVIALAGPLIGLVNGLQADLGFVADGEYSPERPFSSVFDPANPAWGRPAWGAEATAALSAAAR